MYSISEGIRGPKNKIKKSIFIATIYPISSSDDILERIRAVESEFSKASHNSYAYRLLEKNEVKSYISDDGELKGTAGPMILNLLEQGNLVNVILFVTRFYGGINLGRGGLIRSYSSTALDLINNITKMEL